MKIRSLDIVTSVYNEEQSILELYNRICKTLARENGYRWRLIICDNVSMDNSWEVITNLARKDPKVLGIRLSRNFYLDNSFTCGLDQCYGDIAIVMCSDLQDPPEVIPELLRKYEEGHEQVLVKVNSRAELGFIRRNLTRIFYSIISKSSGGLVPGNVSDFRLMSKKVYSAARNLREQKRFLRGLMSWSGFKSTEIEIDRPPRKYGESKFGARKLFSVIAEATESIYAFSTRPLKIISIFGVFFSLISILSIIFLVFRIFSFGVPFPGFGTLAIINLATFSVLLFALGVVSSYVGLIYEETKHRPLYVIDRTTND